MAYRGIAPGGGPGLKRLVPAAFALSVLIVPLAAHPSPPKRSSDLAYGTAAAIRVVRQDRLILGPVTRICVETTLDPDARRIVECRDSRFIPASSRKLPMPPPGGCAQNCTTAGGAKADLATVSSPISSLRQISSGGGGDQGRPRLSGDAHTGHVATLLGSGQGQPSPRRPFDSSSFEARPRPWLISTLVEKSSF